MNDDIPIITIRSNGPISVNGDVILVDENGNEIEHKSIFSLCGCGNSKRMPFCDGSHKN
tara:strand:+ start:1058 stop:1234 length:177 start_codon:yes stop_codon:yes gene_type:complete